MNDKQQFSLWYFFLSVAILLVIQTYLLAPRPEEVSYSQFKNLVKQNLVTDVAVGHETIRGNIKAEGVKQALSEERLKQIKHDGKSTVPFTTIRVEDPKLTQDLDAVGI